jgi:hypothetical protein
VIELDAPLTSPDGASPPRVEHRLVEKVLLCVSLTVVTFLGYFIVGWSSKPAPSALLRTWLDDAIPVQPWAMYLYAWVYTAMIYPAFCVRCPYLFRRVFLGYVVVVVASLLCWIAFPVTAADLRASTDGLDLSVFHAWGLKLNYTLDPPTNCFPSLHLSIAVLAGLSAYTARPRWGALALAPVAGIAVAIVAVKQHFIADGVAGALLGATAWALVVRPARLEGRPLDDVSHGWMGPAAYLAFHCGVYAFAFSLFLAGWRPWER